MHLIVQACQPGSHATQLGLKRAHLRSEAVDLTVGSVELGVLQRQLLLQRVDLALGLALRAFHHGQLPVDRLVLRLSVKSTPDARLNLKRCLL